MDLKWKEHKWDFNPTTDELKETSAVEFCVMDVHRGTLVASVSVRINTAFSAGAPTASVGDDDDLTGMVTVADATITALGTGLKNGTGADLTTQHDASNANGKLYEADDTIELEYTGDALTTVGALSVIVVYAEIE